MANPTPEDFKARYTWAADVPDATIQVYLDDAAQDLGPESCWGAGWQRAVMALAAHNMTLAGLNPTQQGVAMAAGGMRSVKSGTLSLTVADWAGSGGYSGTQYGRDLLALGKRYRGSGPLVVGGAGGGGASGYAKDQPLWAIPEGYRGL